MIATTGEQLLPTIAAEITDDTGRRPADDGLTEVSSPEAAAPERSPANTAGNAETALAALLSEDEPPSTSPPSRARKDEPGDLPDATRSIRPTPADPSEPGQPGEPSPRQVPASVAATDDDPASQPDLSAGPDDTASVRTVERTELPPRIRQALSDARAERLAARAAKGGRLYRVQLAAFNNESDARLYWREVNARLPGLFDEIEPIFNQSVVDQRTYMRIWVGAFDQHRDADGYCAWLKEQGQDCFVMRVDNL